MTREMSNTGLRPPTLGDAYARVERERRIDAAVRAGMDELLARYARMPREAQLRCSALLGPSKGELEDILRHWRAQA